MTNEEIKALAEAAGVRFCGGWIEGNEQALRKFAELVVDNVATQEAVEYCLWPDGSFCEREFIGEHSHKSDDYLVIGINEWDDNGDPIFPGGLI